MLINEKCMKGRVMNPLPMLIPGDIMRRFEGAYRADFSRVRIYAMPEQLRWVLDGLACDEVIYLDPRRMDWSQQEDLHLLGHELWHVLQQRQCGRKGTANIADLEAEADVAATVAVDGCRGTKMLRRSALPSVSRAPRVPQAYLKMAIQRHLMRDQHFLPGTWNLNEAHYALVTDIDAAWRLLDIPLRLGNGATPGEMLATKEVLKRWMGVSIGGQVFTRPGEIVRAFGRDAAALARMVVGRESELKYYNNYGELARALIGEVRSQPSHLYECAMAKAVLGTQEVADDLCSVATKIVNYWNTIYQMLHGPDTSWTNYLLGYSQGEPWQFRGAYFQYHYYTTPLSGLKKAASNRIAVNIALIHDTVDFIKSKAGESHLYRTLTWANPTTGNMLEIEKKDMRNNLGTVNENYEVIQHGRQQRYKMQAGPSFTVSQILSLCEIVGATVQERTSVTYAIFAFWNQVYQKACTPIHTYYEVMVAAANYGVQFNSRASYANNAPLPVVQNLIQIWEHRRELPQV